MKFGNYYVLTSPDKGIERQNPITDKPEICEGFFCEVYRDAEYIFQVDYFCLAVGHEITDLSDEALQAGIRTYLGLDVEYVHAINEALEAAQAALEAADEAAGAGTKIHPSITNRLVTVQQLLTEVLADAQKEYYRSSAAEVSQSPKMSMDTSGLEVAGHVGTWHVIDHVDVEGHNFWLMQHDTYGDSAFRIIVDDQGELVLSNFSGPLDGHTMGLLYQEIMPVDRMPDPSISVAEMKKYGYAWGGMLPIKTAALAAEVMQSCTVYRLYGDDTEGMVMDESELARHAADGGIFGVEKVNWVAYLERQAAQQMAKPSLEDQITGASFRVTDNPSAFDARCKASEPILE